MSIGPEEITRCFRCGEWKPLSEFYADKTKASGRRSICKACDRAKSREYYARNAERVGKRIRAQQRAGRSDGTAGNVEADSP